MNVVWETILAIKMPLVTTQLDLTLVYVTTVFMEMVQTVKVLCISYVMYIKYFSLTGVMIRLPQSF